MNRAIAVFSPAAALVCLSGTAFGQFTYNGASPGGSEWSRALNWVGNAAPAIGGGTDLIATMGPAPANRRNINLVDRDDNANPAFNLNRLTFAANANGGYNMQGSDLRFNNSAVNGGAVIAHNTNDTEHLIDNNIILNTNLRFEGTANNTTTTPVLRLDGIISEVAGNARGLTFIPAQSTMRYRVNGVNTYTGTTTINNGTVVLTGNSNLGTGNLLIGNAGPGGPNNPVQRIAALGGFTATLANSRMELTNDIFVGINNGNAGMGVLQLNGEFRPGVAANAGRIVTLTGGRTHEFVIAGNVQLNGLGTLAFNGDTAPDIQRGRIHTSNVVGAVVRKSDSLGSVVRLQGYQPPRPQPNAPLPPRQIDGMGGFVTVTNATLSVECNVQTAATRINALWQIGGANAPAALIGRSVINGARGAAGPVQPNAGRIFFANNRGVNIAAGSIMEAGGSPGLLALNGGTHVLDPGSSFAVTLNGVEPGTGDGYYGQLLLEEGAALTLAASGSVRPILGIDMQLTDEFGVFNFAPSFGMSFVVIDQDSSLMQSLYVPASPGGFDGSMFMSPDGVSLAQGGSFGHEDLPSGLFFQIDYFGGDTGNDVVLNVVPTPGAAGALGLAGLAAFRRKRR